MFWRHHLKSGLHNCPRDSRWQPHEPQGPQNLLRSTLRACGPVQCGCCQQPRTYLHYLWDKTLLLCKLVVQSQPDGISRLSISSALRVHSLINLMRCCSNAGLSKLLPGGHPCPQPVFVDKVSLEHTQPRLFRLSVTARQSWVVWLRSPRHLLFAPLEKTCAYPCSVVPELSSLLLPYLDTPPTC